jgi:hypothetical protein
METLRIFYDSNGFLSTVRLGENPLWITGSSYFLPEQEVLNIVGLLPAHIRQYTGRALRFNGQPVAIGVELEYFQSGSGSEKKFRKRFPYVKIWE